MNDFSEIQVRKEDVITLKMVHNVAIIDTFHDFT